MNGPLLHSPAQIIAHLLRAKGLGSSPNGGAAWPVFFNNEPGSPDNCITVYTTTGIELGRLMDDGEKQGASSVQIRVRANDGETGYAKARSIAIALDEDVYDEVVSVTPLASPSGAPTEYVVDEVERVGDILSLGEEVGAARRQLFTLNALMFGIMKGIWPKTPLLKGG